MPFQSLPPFPLYVKGLGVGVAFGVVVVDLIVGSVEEALLVFEDVFESDEECIEEAVTEPLDEPVVVFLSGDQVIYGSLLSATIS